MSREGRNNFRCFKHRLIFQTVSRQSLGSQGFNNACHKNMYKYAFFLSLSLLPARFLSTYLFSIMYMKGRNVKSETVLRDGGTRYISSLLIEGGYS